MNALEHEVSVRSGVVSESPYVGVRPYAEEQAAIFRGREAECEVICANMRAWKLTLLYGASGVGKSSLLRAGAAHWLRETARRNLEMHGAADFVPVVFDNWPGDPLRSLAKAIDEAIGKTFEGHPSLNSIPPPPSTVTCRSLERWTRQTGLRLLLILDQFEEYFLYHPQESAADGFSHEFATACGGPDVRVNFLLSIREDQLARLDRFEDQVPRLFENFLRIDHLDSEAAERAIREPLLIYNRSHGTNVGIEDNVVQKVLSQVRTGRVTLGRAGRGAVKQASSEDPEAVRIEAPFLQLVMARLWDEETRVGSNLIREATFDRLGGAERIVQTHLDSVMKELTPSERNTARLVFHHLVTPSGAKIAHAVRDLAEYTELPEDRIESVLSKLSARRILRSVEPPPDQPAVHRYEIFHDVLASAVSYWRIWSVQDRLMSGKTRALFVAWMITYFVGLLAMFSVYFFPGSLKDQPDERNLLLIVACGALGSFVHVVKSFAEYAAGRQLVISWGWWYLLRPFIGVSTAILGYFAFRSLIGAQVEAKDLSQFAIAGLATLCGMFSKELTDKFKEMADTLLLTISPSERADLLEAEQTESAAKVT